MEVEIRASEGAVHTVLPAVSESGAVDLVAEIKRQKAKGNEERPDLIPHVVSETQLVPRLVFRERQRNVFNNRTNKHEHDEIQNEELAGEFEPNR